MAKTLIGLYDTFAEAEQVVQDLAQHGLSHSDMRLITHDGAGRHATATATATEPLAEGHRLQEQLTDMGVPMAEARTYTEWVHQGKALVMVQASDAWAERGLEIMQRSHPANGGGRAAQQSQMVRARVTLYPVSQSTTSARREQAPLETQRVDQDTMTIPVVEEEISVGKRQVERGKARIHSRVEERPVEETVRLHEEKVIVDRHPVDRPATDADLKAAEERTIELTETAEEPVVSKRARVVEEVTVRKEAREHMETVRDTVRHKDVNVEEVGGTQPTDGRGFETYAADCRRHHTTTFAGSGTYYEDYEPAYRYGYDLGTNERYRGRDWAALEADARRDWETRRPGTWERFKAAIRYGWDKVRARS